MAINAAASSYYRSRTLSPFVITVLLLAVTFCKAEVRQHPSQHLAKVQSFKWNSCNRNTPVIVDHFEIKPDPIVLPGGVSISAKFGSEVDINSPTKASVKVQKKIGTSWYDVPCFDGFGTCEYDDVCKVLARQFPHDRDCGPQLTRNNIPCRCPIPRGFYGIENGFLDLNFKLPAAVINGEYRIKANMFNEFGELACYEVELALAAV